MPRALYTDWKNVYKREPTDREVREGEVTHTQFGRMCTKLGVEIIAASTPQAKARVEWSNGIHQDRLIKKMRLQGIADGASAMRMRNRSTCRNGRSLRPNADESRGLPPVA